MKIKHVLFTTLLLPILAFASGCPQLYPNGQEIAVPATTELCNSFYVSRFNGIEKKVVLVSEHIPAGKQLGGEERTNDFHSDSRVGNVPSPHQYLRSGYDKGHMAPAGDAGTEEEMTETFLMTNMTPQEPTLNRVAWRELEEKVRKQISSSNQDIYILTIAVYDKNGKVMNGIPVPTGYWKVVISDHSDYYYADNVPHASVKKVANVSLSGILSK